MTPKGMVRIVTMAMAVVMIFGAGLWTGWTCWKPTPTKPETYAREVRQQDGSLVLERKPQPDAKPVQELPKGAKLERVVQVTVKPHASEEEKVETNGSAPEAKASLVGATFTRSTPCPPVRVDLSLVRMEDQSRRVIASSPDGEVVGGVDIPVEVPDRPRVLRWAAGGSWNPGDRTYGAWAMREVGPFVLGAHVFQVRRDTIFLAPAKWSGQVMVGMRF